MLEKVTWKFLVESGVFVGAELEFRDGFETVRGPLSAIEFVGDRVSFRWEWCATSTLETYLWEMTEPEHDRLAACEALLTDVPVATPGGCVAIPLKTSHRQRATIILTSRNAGRKFLTRADVAKPWELLIARNPQAQYRERVFESVMTGKMMVGLHGPEVANGFQIGLPFVSNPRTLHQALGGLKYDSDKLVFVQHYIEATKDRPVELKPY